MALAVRLYELSQRFPAREKYGLCSQLRRAAVSVPSNIAEGHRRGTREYKHFLRIAAGSVSEVETLVEIANRVGFLDRSTSGELQEKLTILAKQMSALQTALKSKD